MITSARMREHFPPEPGTSRGLRKGWTAGPFIKVTFYQSSLQQSSSSRNAALTGTEQPVQSRASSEAMAGRSLGATFLARSTLGSLGTATPLCYRRSGIVVPGTQRLDFECPNGRMLLQDVWLGHPQGSCGCPSTATPSHGYAEGSCADGPVLTEPTLSQPCCSTQHALKPREQLPNMLEATAAELSSKAYKNLSS